MATNSLEQNKSGEATSALLNADSFEQEVACPESLLQSWTCSAVYVKGCMDLQQLDQRRGAAFPTR